MELIIKIPDKDYEFIKDLQILKLGSRAGYKTIQQNVINAIKNGTPYNPAGDCISREALQVELDDYIDNSLLEISDVKELINNAPAVPQISVFCENTDEKAIRDMRAELQNVIEARPKGEWIIVSDKHGDNVKCPFCGKELVGTDLNFCCKCGADMRPKGDGLHD